MKRLYIIGLMVSVLMLLSMGTAMTVYSQDTDWVARLRFDSEDITGSTVYFGEKDNALDGKDDYDMPKPPMPPGVCLYTFASTDFTEPYDKLHREYKKYPDTSKVWDISLIYNWIPPIEVTATWNSDIIKQTEYGTVFLKDITNTAMINMKQSDSYTFTMQNVNEFQIVCKKMSLGI